MTHSDEAAEIRIKIEQCFVGHNFPNTEIVVRLHNLFTAEIGAALDKLEPFAKSDSPNSNDAIRFCVGELRNHFGIGEDV